MNKSKIAENRIKSATNFRCEFVFGKPDSCTIFTIRKFDTRGNEIESITNPESADPLKYYYKYNKSGKYLEHKFISRNDTSLSTIEYDASGREIKRKAYKNGFLTSDYTNTYENEKLISTSGYNTQKQLIYLASYKYDKNGNTTEIYFFNGKDTTIETRTYDERNRVIKTVSQKPNGTNKNITQFAYDNDTIIMRRDYSAHGFMSEDKYQYDDKKRLIQNIHRDSVNSNNNNITLTKYTYDKKGNLAEERRTHESFPDESTIIQYNYDEAGNLVLQLFLYNAKEKIHKSYIYNEKKQLIKMIMYFPLGYPRGKTDSVIYSYNYDLKTGYKTQEAKEEKNIVSINEYEYNSKGKVIKENNYKLNQKEGKKLVNEIEYKYDSENKLLSKTYKNHLAEIWVESAAKNRNMNTSKKQIQKQKVKNDNLLPQTYTIIYKYNANKQLTEEYEAKELQNSSGNNSQKIKYFYDSNGKLKEEHKYYHNSENISSKYLYEYDKKGNLKKQSFVMGGTPEKISQLKYYYYDSENRLSDEYTFLSNGKEMNHIKFIYDTSGNVIAEKTIKADKSMMKYVYEFY